MMKRTLLFGSIFIGILLGNLIGIHLLLARKDYRIVSRYNHFQIIEKNQRMGIMNPQGNIIFPLLYEKIDSFHYGIARVTKDKKIGYVDTTGKWKIPPVYDDLYLFNSFGSALALQNGKYGWINKRNETVIPFLYKNVQSDFNRNGQTIVSKDGQKYGCINLRNETILDFIYDRIELFDIYMLGEKDSSQGLYDLQGKILLPLTYERIQKSEGPVIPFKQNGKWGIYKSITQEKVYLPYDSIGSYQEGLACVTKDDKFGYLDLSGEPVIPLKFNFATGFHHQHANVSTHGYRFSIDKEGNRIPHRPINYFFGILINKL